MVLAADSVGMIYDMKLWAGGLASARISLSPHIAYLEGIITLDCLNSVTVNVALG